MDTVKPTNLFSESELCLLKWKNAKPKQSNLTKHMVSVERMDQLFKEIVLGEDGNTTQQND